MSGSPAALRQAAIVTLKLIAALRQVDDTTASYKLLKDDLSDALKRLATEQSCRLPFSSHMVINGNDHNDNEKLFHTMSQHFRKTKRRDNVRISWMKFRSFNEAEKSHYHVILFHDVPLYELFRTRRNSKKYDLPRFANKADRLRRVPGMTDTCFRSYNYKINIKEHNDPMVLVGEYMLDPKNFRPDLVSESGGMWFSVSRGIIHRRQVMPLFNEVKQILGSLEKVFVCLSMEVFASIAVNGVVRGNTDAMKQLFIVRRCDIPATCDRIVSIIPGAPEPLYPRGTGAVRQPLCKQPP